MAPLSPPLISELVRLLLITCILIPHNIDTKTLCERYILPLLRANNIRLVQVARAGRFEEDGIEFSTTLTSPTLFTSKAFTNSLTNSYSPALSLSLPEYTNALSNLKDLSLTNGWQKNSLERTATPLATTRKRPHEYQEANT